MTFQANVTGFHGINRKKRQKITVKEYRHKGILYYYKLVALFAFEIMLAFSAWGYIRMDYVSVSLVPLVVLAIAYLMGTGEGVAAGLVFAATGMWKACVAISNDAYGDILFSPIRSGKPVQSLLLCFVPRIVLGLVAGILFYYAKKAQKGKIVKLSLAAIIAQLVHVTLVFWGMEWFFPETGTHWWSAFNSLRTIGMDIELVASVLTIGILYYFCNSTWMKETINKIEEGVQVSKHAKVVYWQWIALAVIAACGLSVCLNLSDGIDRVIQLYEIMPGETSAQVLHHILVQFVIAQMALFVLIGILESMIYYYYASAEVRSRMDLMTGAYNRAMIIQNLTHDLKNLKKGQKVFFMMMDVDYFKQINDTYGHDFGDQVLISFVWILKRNFSTDAMVGRMGGDEFCVYCRHEDIRKRLPHIMDQVMREFDRIVVPGDRIGALNFSYGVSWGEAGMEFEEVYKRADQDLYEHKHIRRQYVDNSEGNV